MVQPRIVRKESNDLPKLLNAIETKELVWGFGLKDPLNKLLNVNTYFWIFGVKWNDR